MKITLVAKLDCSNTRNVTVVVHTAVPILYIRHSYFNLHKSVL